MDIKANVVICGAGIAGVSAAYFLTVKHGIQDVLLIDEFPPLSLTSDHSSECYRNWWPGPGNAMVALMNHSIDLMEKLARESGNVFNLNRRGYLYCTAEREKIGEMRRVAEQISSLGGGPLRVYEPGHLFPAYIPAPLEGFTNYPDGADLLLDPELIQAYFPYLSDKVVAALHVRRAGWLSAQQLGMYLLEQARENGARLMPGKVCGVSLKDGRVEAIQVEGGRQIQTSQYVIAAGPHLKEAGRMLGLDLPVYNELHLKVAIKDSQAVLGRGAPLVIWSDPQTLDWTPEERELLEAEDKHCILLEELPSGVHTRPEGGLDSQMIIALWEYDSREMEPVWPVPEDQQYPEAALRGLVKMVPGMMAYVQRPVRPFIDGGYYTRTVENRPLVGKLPVSGAYVIGGLSGFGIMASCAAGELLAAHVTGTPLPAYAPAFSLERYADPEYQNLLAGWEGSGQL